MHRQSVSLRKYGSILAIMAKAENGEENMQ